MARKALKLGTVNEIGRDTEATHVCVHTAAELVMATGSRVVRRITIQQPRNRDARDRNRALAA
jgi:hypothetical protein